MGPCFYPGTFGTGINELNLVEIIPRALVLYASMDMAKAAGLEPGQRNAFSDKNKLIQYINLKLAALNQPICGKNRRFD